MAQFNAASPSLDDVIILVLHYIWTDLVRLLVAVKLEPPHRECLNPFHDGGRLKSRDLEELEHQHTEQVLKAVKAVIVKFRYTWSITFFVSTTTVRKSFKESVSPVSKENNQDDIAQCRYVQDGCRHTVKHHISVVFAMLMLFLHYTYSNSSHCGEIQLDLSSQLEISSQQSVYGRIDTRKMGIHGIHYAVATLKVKHKTEETYPLNQDDNHTLKICNDSSNTTAIPICKLPLQNVSLSNCTETYSGLQFSENGGSLFSIVVLVCNVLWYTVILTAGIVETAPVGREKAPKRSGRSVMKSFAVDLKGSPNTGYCAMMSFGKFTEQKFCMLVDTGSANLGLAGKQLSGIQEYFITQPTGNSLVNTNKPVSVSYSGGDWSGTLVRDSVSIGGSQQVEVEFALITTSTMFFIPGAPWVGILGLAYNSLSKPDASVQTFWSVLQEFSGLRDMFAINLCPHINFINQGGIMEFGDISDTLYSGPILYTSIVKELYYNVLVTNLTVGADNIDLPCTEFNNNKAIIDSGTTDIYLPSNTFEAVVKAFKTYIEEHVPLTVPDSFWRGGSKLSWPTESKRLLFELFPTFYIGFAQHENSSSEFSLGITPQIYLRQVSGSEEERVTTNCLPLCDFFVFGIKGRERGMVIGGNVMLGFTTLFDRENKRIGFAKSTCKYADNSPGHVPYITGPYPRNPEDCECHGCSSPLSSWNLIIYISGAIVFPITLLAIVYAIIKKCRTCLPSRCCKTILCTCKCCKKHSYSTSCVSSDSPAARIETVSPFLPRQNSVDSTETVGVAQDTTTMDTEESARHSGDQITCEEQGDEDSSFAVEEQHPSVDNSCLSASSGTSYLPSKPPVLRTYMFDDKNSTKLTVAVLLVVFSL